MPEEANTTFVLSATNTQNNQQRRQNYAQYYIVKEDTMLLFHMVTIHDYFPLLYPILTLSNTAHEVKSDGKKLEPFFS